VKIVHLGPLVGLGIDNRVRERISFRCGNEHSSRGRVSAIGWS